MACQNWDDRSIVVFGLFTLLSASIFPKYQQQTVKKICLAAHRRNNALLEKSINQRNSRTGRDCDNNTLTSKNGKAKVQNRDNILLAMTLIRDDFRDCFTRFFAGFCTDERRSISRRCCAAAGLTVAARSTNRCSPSRGVSVMAAMSDMMSTLQ